MPLPGKLTILHYAGYTRDQGGILSVVRALAAADRFDCVLGVSRGFVTERAPSLALVEFTPLEAERLGLRTIWRARTVAREVQRWLEGGEGRILHAHSRAGLAVALWLQARGERRVVASVHCYGRRKFFYRWASGRLGTRLFWLSPAMKRHYGIGDGVTWDQCIPGSVAPAAPRAQVERRASGELLRLAGVGLLVPWKRWHLVLEALALLEEPVRRRVRFTHLGGGDGSAESQEYAAGLRQLTGRLGLDSIVEWRGAEPSAAGLWAQVDCLVIAARNEPLSIAMLEALAAEVPVLAADSGGAADVLTAERTGWLYRCGDAPDLARAIRRLAADGSFRGGPISAPELARFSAARVAADWEAVYRRVAGAQSDGGAE